MPPALTIAFKDLRLFWRDRMALFWSLAFPLMFGLFFGSIFGTDGGDRAAMAVAVVDESDSEGSRAFVQRLRESAALEVDTVADAAQAQAQVRKGERVAYVRIPAGFEDGAIALFGRDPDDGAVIEIGVDPARTAEQGYLQGLVSQSLFQGLGRSFVDGAAMRRDLAQARRQLADDDGTLPPQRRAALATLFDALDDVGRTTPPASATDGVATTAGFGEGMVTVAAVARDDRGLPRSPYEITFPSAIVWGLVGCATAFASSLVRERTAGTLLRLQVAPIGRAQLLLGKGLACFFAGIGTSVVLLAIGVVALGVRVAAPGVLAAGIVLAAACFTGVMMVLAVLGKTEAAVAGGSWVILMPLAMIGGGMIPLIAMPAWMLGASVVSPFRWSILAIEGGIWRDLDAADAMLPFAVLLASAVLLYGLAAMIFRRAGR